MSSVIRPTSDAVRISVPAIASMVVFGKNVKKQTKPCTYKASFLKELQVQGLSFQFCGMG